MSDNDTTKQEFEKLIETMSKDELHHYLRLFASSYYIARHDLGGNDVSVIPVMIMLIKERLQNLIQIFKDSQGKKNYLEKIIALENDLERLTSASHKLMTKLGNFFSVHSSRIGDKALLIVCPHEVAQEVQRLYHSVDIKLLEGSVKGLHIPFPNSIFFGILHELVKNAINNSKENCQIFISWEVLGDGFILRVEDTNVISDQITTKSFIPLEIFKDVSSIKDKDESGLGLINRLISLVGGSVLFSQSRELKGLLVRIQIPIRFYVLDGDLKKIGDPS